VSGHRPVPFLIDPLIETQEPLVKPREAEGPGDPKALYFAGLTRRNYPMVCSSRCQRSNGFSWAGL